MSPEYLRDVAGGEVNFRDRGPQLTRGSRAIKLWLSLQTFGLQAFREAIARGIALAEEAERAIEATPGLEIVTPAQLGIVTFVATGVDSAELIEKVVAEGYSAPSSTVLRGLTVLRLCTINPRTTDEEIRETVARIASTAACGPRESPITP
jgi:aromatic-L-amino-acid decarboxylase